MGTELKSLQALQNATERNSESLLSVCVGTYAKYNSGNLSGAWLNLEDFNYNYLLFVDKCHELHSDEESPEFMYQDWEGSLSFLVKEYDLKRATHVAKHIIEEADSDEVEAFIKYLEYYQISDLNDCEKIEKHLETFRDMYQGYFENDTDFGWEIAESGILSNCPNELRYYFDIQAYTRDLFLDGFDYVDGYIFANY